MSFLLLNTQCEDDDVGIQPTDCDYFAIVDDDQYQNATSGFFQIVSAEINGDCLNLEISASGCDGSTWSLELFASSDIMESMPVQRSIRAVFANNEACLAVFTRTITFDLSNLQIEGATQIMFNLQDYSESILYSY